MIVLQTTQTIVLQTTQKELPHERSFLLAIERIIFLWYNDKKEEKGLAKRGFVIENEKLMADWDYEKNTAMGIFPDKVTQGSNQKVYWLCHKCGFSWQAKIVNRSNGRGCPSCSGRVVVKGKNDLCTTNPNLAQEWHPTKNHPLKPTEVSHGSGKNVWWICPNGHEYKATVLHRSDGTGCPICNTGKQTSFPEQAIYYYVKQLYPDAINRCSNVLPKRYELDIFVPSKNLAIEYDGVFWHHKNTSKRREREKYQFCKERGIYLIRIRELENVPNGVEVATITGDRSLFDFNADFLIDVDEKIVNKEIDNVVRRLLNYIDESVNMFTRKNLYKINTDIDVNIERDKNIIASSIFVKKEKSLEHLRPDLLLDWDYEKNIDVKPSQLAEKSGRKVWWKCHVCGHEWEATVGHRATGTGCNNCYRKNNVGGKCWNARKVYQYSLDGVYIKEWDCITDASKAKGCNGSNITSCAKHVRPNAGGYRWEYEKFEKLPQIVKVKKPKVSKNRKAILMLNENNEIIGEYCSVTEAGEKLGINPTSISKALNGHIKTAGGYYWKSK